MTAKQPPGLSLRDIELGSDIAVRFWEPRKGWSQEQLAPSLRREADRLRDQSARADRGEVGGNPRAWRFAASMLEIQASYIGGAALCGRVSNGYACAMPAGGSCPDCGPAVHDVPEGS